jgi:ATP-dependent RNA helicase DeaD
LNDDLSNIHDIDKFADEMEKVAKELYRVLKKGKFCAILIGDTRRNKMYQPMAYKVMDRFLKAGFQLKEDIIKRMVSMEFNRLIDYYSNAPEIQDATDERGSRRGELGSREFGSSDRGERGSRNPSQAQEGYSRLFLNFGKTDGLYPNQLIELINKCVPGKVQIGKIDLRDNFSFFEVESAESDRVIKEMSGFEVDGRRISVEPAQGRKDSSDRGPRGGGEYKGRRDRKDFSSGGGRPSYGSGRREESGDKPWRRSNSSSDRERRPSTNKYRR